MGDVADDGAANDSRDPATMGDVADEDETANDW
jgi:hypothetical protein